MQSSHTWSIMRYNHTYLLILIHCYSSTNWQQDVRLLNQTFQYSPSRVDQIHTQFGQHNVKILMIINCSENVDILNPSALAM